MKTYKYLLAAVATVALASCTQDFLDEQGRNPQTEGPRTIAVSFGPQTRTALDRDGVTPKFENGDEILVATTPKDMTEEPKTEPCTISVDSKGNASFTTTLTGALTAYYPASAAGEGEKIGFAIPAMQNGKFADANYAWATIPADATAATFENVFPLFVITPPEGAKSLTIKSLPTIGGDGQRSGEPHEICNDLDNPYTITVKGTDTDGIYYVVLSDPVNLSDLSFDLQSETAGQGWMLGITEAQAGDNNAVLPNKAYKVGGAANWHEYVTVGDYKWATMNLKTSETSGNYDDYYVWGTTVMAYSNIQAPPCSTAVMKTANPYGEEVYERDTWSAGNGFSWENCPFTAGIYSEDEDEENKNVFTKYHGNKAEYSSTGTADGKTRLDLCDDAAYVRWGGAWRIPTKEELSALGSDVQQNGTLKDKGSSPYVFENASAGYYWSSTLFETNPSKAYCWKVSMDSDGPAGDLQEIDRYYGCTIRAIIDDTNSAPSER